MKGILGTFVMAVLPQIFSVSMAGAQDSLPFPEPSSASTTGKTLKDSKHRWRQPGKHLPADAPNRYKMTSTAPIPTGKVKIEVQTK